MKQREIKFRFLRKDINGNKFWEYINIPDDLYSDDFSDLGADFSTIGQFTGLTDKNGKETYEGDIVDYNGEGAEVVEFENGCFWVGLKGELPALLFEQTESCEPEIIGNIYGISSNKPLLKKDKKRV